MGASVQTLADSQNAAATITPSDNFQNAVPMEAASRNLSSQSLSRIREVVREEIQNMPSSPSSQANTDAAKIDRRSPADLAALSATVDGKISTVTSQGTVSAGELETVFGLIATLPPKERRAAMMKLNRAMNNGQISTQY